VRKPRRACHFPAKWANLPEFAGLVDAFITPRF
jgi:hypothetical protein